LTLLFLETGNCLSISEITPNLPGRLSLTGGQAPVEIYLIAD